MSFENLLLETRDGLAVLTVNRPDKLNALNDKTVAELDAAFQALEGDASVRGVIVTGAGEKAFVAGADIAELATQSPIDGKDRSVRGQRVLDRIEHLGKPVIAAVNGFALGGGCELALACHVRVASENAKLGTPEVKLGIMCGYAGTQRLPRLVGRGRSGRPDLGRPWVGIVRITSPSGLLAASAARGGNMPATLPSGRSGQPGTAPALPARLTRDTAQPSRDGLRLKAGRRCRHRGEPALGCRQDSTWPGSCSSCGDRRARTPPGA